MLERLLLLPLGLGSLLHVALILLRFRALRGVAGAISTPEQVPTRTPFLTLSLWCSSLPLLPEM